MLGDGYIYMTIIHTICCMTKVKTGATDRAYTEAIETFTFK